MTTTKMMIAMTAVCQREDEGIAERDFCDLKSFTIVVLIMAGRISRHSAVTSLSSGSLMMKQSLRVRGAGAPPSQGDGHSTNQKVDFT